MSPEVAVPFFLFGMPVALVFIVKYFKFREKQLEAGGANPKLLAAVRAEYETKQQELEARIENLESILIEKDDQLDRRLGGRSGSPRPAALPIPRGAGAPAALPAKGDTVEPST